MFFGDDIQINCVDYTERHQAVKSGWAQESRVEALSDKLDLPIETYTNPSEFKNPKSQ